MKDGLHTDEFGTQHWYQNGELHREDGPAVIHTNGNKFWYQNGLLHREDGPAIVYIDGYKEWWIHGYNYSESNFKIYLIQHNIKQLI